LAQVRLRACREKGRGRKKSFEAEENTQTSRGTISDVYTAEKKTVLRVLGNSEKKNKR
jgi:hypothetical protein